MYVLGSLVKLKAALSSWAFFFTLLIQSSCQCPEQSLMLAVGKVLVFVVFVKSQVKVPSPDV